MRNKRNLKEEQGITLIALIITIIVLVILAAVAINTAYNTGIIQYAIKGTEDYAKQAINENKVMEQTADNMSIATLEVKAISRGSGVADDSKVKAGEIVKKAEETGEGEAKQEKDNYTDISGKKATIPTGFKVSTEPTEQLIDNGLVIQDEEGNEFVWVPCYVGEKPAGASENLQKYEKHIYAESNKDDTSGSTQNSESDKWKTYQYTKYTDWTDNAASSYGNTSVEKYGGFYIARYEAGWEESDTSKFERDSSQYVETFADITSKRNVNSGKPVSKANVFGWNFITQENALTVADNMYANDSSVDSKLVDGTAWDTVTSWIESSGINATNSSQYGNYIDNKRDYNGWYAEHITTGLKSGKTGNTGWAYAKNYTKASENIKLQSIRITDQWNEKSDNYVIPDGRNYSTENNDFDTRIEIATGSVSEFAKKNIYDLAGNMFEWTTEIGKHNAEGKTFAVRRGGSFDHYGSNCPLCFRHGDNTSSSNTAPFIGFRVVLYVK